MEPQDMEHQVENSAGAHVAQTEKTPPAEDKSSTSSIVRWLTIASQTKAYAWGITFGALYLSGFLALNASLVAFGVADFELVSGRYIIPGANFAFFLLCFYFFLGRAIYLSPRWLAKTADRLKHLEPLSIRNTWAVIALIQSFSLVAQFACLSTAFYAGLAFTHTNVAPFFAFLAVYGLFRYFFDVTNLDLRNPRFIIAFDLLCEGISIIIFAYHVTGDEIYAVLAIYLGIAMFLNTIKDLYDRKIVTLDTHVFTGTYGAAFLMSLSLIFGATLYGKVSSKMGGGRPNSVVAKLAEKGGESLVKALASDGVAGLLIHQTDKFIYLDTAKGTLRLRTDDVAGLVVQKVVQEPFKLSIFGFSLSPPSKSDKASDKNMSPNSAASAASQAASIPTGVQ